jgi:hypothetical protein
VTAPDQQRLAALPDHRRLGALVGGELGVVVRVVAG